MQVLFCFVPPEVKHCASRSDSTGADVIGLDWTVDMADARRHLGADQSVQVPFYLPPYWAVTSVSIPVTSSALLLSDSLNRDPAFARAAPIRGQHELNLSSAVYSIFSLRSQGNVDPVLLFAKPDAIEAAVRDVLQKAGPKGHILNLGHGVVVGAPKRCCPQNICYCPAVCRLYTCLRPYDKLLWCRSHGLLMTCWLWTCRHARGVGGAHVPAQQRHQTVVLRGNTCYQTRCQQLMPRRRMGYHARAAWDPDQSMFVPITYSSVCQHGSYRYNLDHLIRLTRKERENSMSRLPIEQLVLQDAVTLRSC